MEKEFVFKGVGTALVTPFIEVEGSEEPVINYDETKRLIEFQINNNVDSLILLGTTGEATTISEDEREAFLKFCIKEIDNRVPVIVGTGSNDTKKAVLRTKTAEKLGADAVLVVTPYYNKTTQKGLIAHFTKIANSTNLPVILYNVPSRTGVNMLPNTVLELSKVSNIVGIKEASGNLDQVKEILELVSNDFAIYSGNDDQISDIYKLGGVGVISVLSNLYPQDTKDMCVYLENNDYINGDKLQNNLLSLIKTLFIEVNPIPIKHALNYVGINAGTLRLPLVDLDDEFKPILESEIDSFNKVSKTNFNF